MRKELSFGELGSNVSFTLTRKHSQNTLRDSLLNVLRLEVVQIGGSTHCVVLDCCR